jgi:hypothetical protein
MLTRRLCVLEDRQPWNLHFLQLSGKERVIGHSTAVAGKPQRELSDAARPAASAFSGREEALCGAGLACPLW